MARSVPWRRTLSDACCWHQAEAQNATIYILRETGPTGFLLKEEGESKNFKVFLGDPHSCTCPVFRKEKDLCKHISWLLLKKFRVPKENPVSWQLGLVEREINEILHGLTAPRQNQSDKPKSAKVNEDGRETVQQRDIDKDDVCPICQEELLHKRLPVTYCKFGCGNSVHIKCMKIWAEHQQGIGEKAIKCPMCREDFGPFNLLKMEMRNANDKQTTAGRMDRHLGTCCRSCHLAPIEGKCYRCSHCTEFYLCQSCFNTPTHTQHSFEYRHKRNQRWRAAERMFGAAVPQAIANDLQNRELSASDYDVLLQLDKDKLLTQFDQSFIGSSSSHSSLRSDIPEEVIITMPMERVRDGSRLLQPGNQCRVCLRGYETGQLVRRLPCKHKFHKDCIDNWLLHSRPTCPTDGLTVWHPVTGLLDLQAQTRTVQSRRTSASSHSEELDTSGTVTLEIPGIGLASLVQGAHQQGQLIRSHAARIVSMPHHPPTSLELSGFGIGSNGDRMPASEQDTNPPLPGNRLLQRAMNNRARLATQISSMQAREEATRSTQSPPAPVHDLGDLLRMGNNSASSASERKPPSGTVRTGDPSDRLRGRGQHRHTPPEGTLLRRRSSSQERRLSQERNKLIEAYQDLYLGSNPRTTPAQTEVASNQRKVINPFRRMSSNSSRPPHRSDQNSEQTKRTVDIVMEGCHIDNLTLRDIIG